MNTLVININWEYFLGLVGAIISLAYIANGRLTRLETSLEWLKDAVRDLQLKADSRAAKLFRPGSPVLLTRGGQRVLKASGLKDYINSHRNELERLLPKYAQLDPYKLELAAFHLLGQLKFEPRFDKALGSFAFANAMNTDLLRRLGAIYFRDMLGNDH